MGGGVISSERGGKRRRKRAKAKPMAEINVTPFVDVMLVLLIIFMVAAPLLQVGVPIELPETAANALPTEDEEPLTITMTSEGQVLIQNTEISRDELIPKLRAVIAERTDDRVFLRADGGIDYGAVMEIMGALNAGGFNDIGLVTDAGGPTLDGQGG